MICIGTLDTVRNKRKSSRVGHLAIEVHRDANGEIVVMHQRRVAGDGSVMWSVTDDKDNLSTRVWCRDDQAEHYGLRGKFEDFDWELCEA